MTHGRKRLLRWAFITLFALLSAVAFMGVLAPQLLERAVTQLVLTLSFQWSEPIVFAAAGKDGSYYAIGDLLSEHVGLHHGFPVTVLETAGSLENIELLRSGAADFGLIQGGLRESLEGVVAVADLKQQFVHLIVPSDSAVRSITDLAGKRVSLGPEMSGFHALAEAVFEFYDLNPPPEFVHHPADELTQAFEEGRVDAAFTVYSLYAPQAEAMLHDGRYRLAALHHGAALSAYIPGVRDTAIPARTYGPQRTQPVTNLPTISVSMLLVARPGANNAHVRAIMQSVYDMGFIRRARLGELTEASGKAVRDLPLHEAAAAFYGRNEPITSDRFEIASFFLAGLVCLASVFHFAVARVQASQTQRRRERMVPYFEVMLEFSTRAENSNDVAELTTILHEMMAAQRRAEREWLEGKLETEHMENLYAVYNIHSRNVFNKIFIVMRQKPAVEAAAASGYPGIVPEA